MAYVPRQHIIDALVAANVDFDEAATVAELRPAYDELMRNQAVNHADNIDAGGAAQIRELQEDLQRVQQQLADALAAQQQQPPLLDDQQPIIDLVPAGRRFEFAAFEAMIDAFTGDDLYDVTKWFQDAEDAFGLLMCPEYEKYLCVRRRLSGTAQKFLRTTTAHTYDDLKAAMIEEFGRAFTVSEVLQQLRSRSIRSGESVKSYIIDMQTIAMRAAVGEAELVEAIVDGMRDSSANISILLGARTVRQLKDVADRYERKCRANEAKPAADPVGLSEDPAAAVVASDAAADSDAAQDEVIYDEAAHLAEQLEAAQWFA